MVSESFRKLTLQKILVLANILRQPYETPCNTELIHSWIPALGIYRLFFHAALQKNLLLSSRKKVHFP